MPKYSYPGSDQRIAERQQKAFAMKKAGATFDQIARSLGVSPALVFRDVNKILKELRKQAFADAEDYRQLELERLDALQTQVWQTALKGDGPSIDRVLRIMERRARLLGLDAPQKQEVSGELSMMALLVKQLNELENEDQENIGGLALPGAGENFEVINGVEIEVGVNNE